MFARSFPLFAIILLAPEIAPVSAGTIEWQQSLNSDVNDSGVFCDMKLQQTGNESARAVSVEWEFAGEKRSSPMWLEINPGTVVRTEAVVFDRPTAPGWYPVLAMLRYADVNGYPYSSLLAHLQAVDTPPSLNFFVKPLSMEISGSASDRIVIKYAGDKPVDVTCRVVAPKELEVREPQSAVRIPMRPGESVETPVTIDASGALPGSTMTAFVIIEGSRDGVSEAGIGKIQVNVIKAGAGNFGWKFGALAVLAICVFLIAQPVIRRRRQDKMS